MSQVTNNTCTETKPATTAVLSTALTCTALLRTYIHEHMKKSAPLLVLANCAVFSSVFALLHFPGLRWLSYCCILPTWYGHVICFAQASGVEMCQSLSVLLCPGHSAEPCSDGSFYQLWPPGVGQSKAQPLLLGAWYVFLATIL